MVEHTFLWGGKRSLYAGGKKCYWKGWTNTRVGLYTRFTIFNINWRDTKAKTVFDQGGLHSSLIYLEYH